MEDPIVSRIIDLLIDLCNDTFSGLKGKFQLFNIKRRLKKQIFDEILSKYGERDFYNDLNRDNTVLSDHILPGPDMPIPTSGACFTWDLYSKEQKERRITQFFYYHEISYLRMVEYNFPNLKKHFRRYNDIPYRVVVEVDHNEDANPHDFTSQPSIQYYYIASPSEDILVPIICQTEEKAFSDYEQIMQTIQESYLKQGRTAKRLTTTRTGFTFTTTSRRTDGDDPLSDYVYSSIKESLEDVFGSM